MKFQKKKRKKIHEIVEKKEDMRGKITWLRNVTCLLNKQQTTLTHTQTEKNHNTNKAGVCSTKVAWAQSFPLSASPSWLSVAKLGPSYHTMIYQYRYTWNLVALESFCLTYTFCIVYDLGKKIFWYNDLSQ